MAPDLSQTINSSEFAAVNCFLAGKLRRGSEVQKRLTSGAGTGQAVRVECQHWIAVNAASSVRVIHPPPEEDGPATIPAHAWF